MSRWWKQGLAAAFMAVGLAWAGWSAVWLIDDPLSSAAKGRTASTRVVDRRGLLLTEYLSPDETRGRWETLDRISPYLTKAALAAEDQRFYKHGGVDPAAVLRAAWQNLTAGRIVSGGSTITMQLARRLHPGPRTYFQKFKEALLAWRMERSHAKDEILEAYLNLVPCGNLIYGLPAAANVYLDKAPNRLSPAEAAFLMALPQAPSRLNPYQRRGLALKRRTFILKRMADLGCLSPETLARALEEPLALQPLEAAFKAPHFTAWLKRRLGENRPPLVETTIDLDLQQRIQRLTAEAVHQAEDRAVGQAAVVVMDHRTREILAWVGSADFFDPREGQNDGVLALRQPGSTMKPFTYAAAFDDGLPPSFKVDDSPVEYGLEQGVYTPVNYDRRWHGQVGLRTALASSLNVPAVKVLEKVGLNRVYQRMKAAGLTTLDQEPDFYGLGLTLGCGEVRLLDLANAYATLADGGRYRKPVYLKNADGAAPPARQAFSPQAAFLVTDILSDDAARASGFGRNSLLDLPFPAAAKTGTSKNFRDNWCVGYTSRVVAAVWAGNFDARPMGRVSGVAGAGPLWRRVMRLVAEYHPPEAFAPPEGVVQMDVCPETGLLAADGCPNRQSEFFIKNAGPAGHCLLHHRRAQPAAAPRRDRLAIVSPRPGERYLYDPGIEPGFQRIELKAAAPSEFQAVAWWVNDRETARSDLRDARESAVFHPLTRGVMDIRVVGWKDGRPAAVDRVRITVD